MADVRGPISDLRSPTTALCRPCGTSGMSYLACHGRAHVSVACRRVLFVCVAATLQCNTSIVYVSSLRLYVSSRRQRLVEVPNKSTAQLSSAQLGSASGRRLCQTRVHVRITGSRTGIHFLPPPVVALEVGIEVWREALGS
jgi:hypothetical protein